MKSHAAKEYMTVLSSVILRSVADMILTTLDLFVSSSVEF